MRPVPVTIDIAPFAQARVDSFQFTSPQERGLPFYQNYIRRSGSLDGKVSCIKIIRR